MTTIPLYLDPKGYSSQDDRQLIEDLSGGFSSICNAESDYVVSAGGSMTTSVSAGAAIIKGTTNSDQGSYYCRTTSTTSITHSTADVSNGRWDAIYLAIRDATEAGGVNNDANIAVVTGTPGALATITNITGLGTQPASSIPLAYVFVAAGASSISSSVIFDRRPRKSGRCSVTTEESTTSTSYTYLATRDVVPQVVLPTAGLIAVWYQAMWKESVNNQARALIFIGENGQKVADSAEVAPVEANAFHASGRTDKYKPLGTNGFRLASWPPDQDVYTGDVTTGQSIGVQGGSSYPGGGPVYIFAAAGTYDISVRYQVTASGSVTAKNRKLYVAVKDFDYQFQF